MEDVGAPDLFRIAAVFEELERPLLDIVVGGGIAGVTAALEAAEAGEDVILVEREASLGGRVTRFNRYFPKLCHPTCGLEIIYQRIRKTA